MEFLRTFTLKVELFAGTEIRDVASELCQLADRIGVMCEAQFNSVKLWARPGDYPPLLVEAYEEQLQNKSTHKIAQVSR